MAGAISIKLEAAKRAADMERGTNALKEGLKVMSRGMVCFQVVRKGCALPASHLAQMLVQ